ncbi:MAG: tyrosine-type recombinase/integrase [Bdellovibrionales bacterium]
MSKKKIIKKKYINVPRQPGIRKNTITERYQAKKKIKGKQYAETFETIREAQHWRNTFDGENFQNTKIRTTSTLGYVWERMKVLHFPSLELSTQRIWERRWKPLSVLANFHMEEVTPSVINRWIDEQKSFFLSEEYRARGPGFSGRCNLDNELNLFTTIFNWYKGEDEFEGESRDLFTPIRPRHKKMAFIREPTVKAEQKKIPVEAAFKFFSALPELYCDLATVQFFCAGRIGEVAGIQISNIYLDEDYMMIKDSVSWCNASKMFEYLKPYPKNKEPRRVHIHSWLREIIERRLRDRRPDCRFLFHINGRPLNYCTIQSNYRMAQMKTGIPYRGTHCLRHGMATLARRVGGMGLDSVMAMTGHKDLKLADHYSKIDGEVQKDTSLRILEHIKGLGLGTEVVDTGANIVPFRRVK